MIVFTGLSGNDRSDLAMWYLQNGPKVTEGDNVVNTILVEFRAFDTMGELSVLGMAAIVIAAVVTSMPRYPFMRGTHPAPIGHAELNTIPMKTLLKIIRLKIYCFSITIAQLSLMHSYHRVPDESTRCTFCVLNYSTWS